MTRIRSDQSARGKRRNGAGGDAADASAQEASVPAAAVVSRAARPHAGARAAKGAAHKTQEKKTQQKAPSASKVSSLSDRAYQEIKDLILTLFFLPGQYLNEAAICDLLDLGRTPVHQALQLLQVEGLVEVVPRKGVIVRPDSVGEVIAILDARILVEVELVRRAVAHATRDDVAELGAILDKTNRRHGGGSIDAFVESDRAFHVKVAAMSKNAILADFVRLMHERSTRFWYLHLWQTIDLFAATREHRSILEAIEAHDAERAARAMRKHIDSLRERLQHINRHAPARTARPAAAHPGRAR
ncbi:GntR family transcriptional regulator [Rhodovulum sp. PH10]|uniref:GntR family transcriptional regulator n=1 Tax=Rhodovulum sp. PH10 TaxID=1187851 RepID=UPI00178C227B|nr:GntR family transcriptional regulator [Rhodovulum sp. PH10]